MTDYFSSNSDDKLSICSDEVITNELYLEANSHSIVSNKAWLEKTNRRLVILPEGPDLSEGKRRDAHPREVLVYRYCTLGEIDYARLAKFMHFA